ncbi:zinc-ribbon domain containing protein [Chitinimonas lacunae]|uniref:Zinc-ribbon domain containing protein n=1 Tax=Chitinimonas lacunae TaxID=1963018 RepID=A0ABV8MIX0_9NEIS
MNRHFTSVRTGALASAKRPAVQSGKQKRAAIKLRRKHRQQREQLAKLTPGLPGPRPKHCLRVNRNLLAPFNSYDEPEFLRRGYYEDQAFTCRDCGSHQVWRAAQQQWWYETAKGYVYSTAIRCLPCRQRRRPPFPGRNKTP